MGEKIKVASQWLESCAGCHMSFLDIDEKIVELLKYVELSSSPDHGYEAPPEGRGRCGYPDWRHRQRGGGGTKPS